LMSKTKGNEFFLLNMPFYWRLSSGCALFRVVLCFDFAATDPMVLSCRVT
jgi:hypothetical protein